MLNIAQPLYDWCRAALPFALATVVDAGDPPSSPGPALAVDTEGRVVGGIPGGCCVQKAVYENCVGLLRDGDGPVRARFGRRHQDLSAAPGAGGAEVDVLVQRVDPVAQPHLVDALDAIVLGRSAALAQVVDGPGALLGRTLYVPERGPHRGTLGDGDADRAVVAQARAHLRAGRTGCLNAPAAGPRRTRLSALLHTHASCPRLLIFGAADCAAALSRAGQLLGCHVTVCDALPAFATQARFPYADEVVADRPHRYLERAEVDGRTAICVLTHDAECDIPLLCRALSLPVGYVGATGSRRTHERRLQLLREAGVPEDRLARLHVLAGPGPGASTPEEQAIAITADIIAHTDRDTAAMRFPGP
ncbi:XdhC/CoxI family protein [Streptomyces sp. NPDC006617]|uniref:XdhC/CoxI family protein n=1 Tax=Streptomyces sp. NPDC006617 TaxID=3155354 RepID=UPI0033A59B2B